LFPNLYKEIFSTSTTSNQPTATKIQLPHPKRRGRPPKIKIVTTQAVTEETTETNNQKVY